MERYSAVSAQRQGLLEALRPQGTGEPVRVRVGTLASLGPFVGIDMPAIKLIWRGRETETSVRIEGVQAP